MRHIVAGNFVRVDLWEGIGSLRGPIFVSAQHSTSDFTHGQVYLIPAAQELVNYVSADEACCAGDEDVPSYCHDGL